jgi:hypothetical protein
MSQSAGNDCEIQAEYRLLKWLRQITPGRGQYKDTKLSNYRLLLGAYK